MNRRQKSLFINILTVSVVTIIAMFALFDLRNHVNRKEAGRAITYLATVITDFKKNSGYLPPKRYVEAARKKIPENVRLSNFYYRARWISFDDKPDTPLAYSRLIQNSVFYKSCYIVLKLDCTIETVPQDDFEKKLEQIQSEAEKTVMSPAHLK